MSYRSTIASQPKQLGLTLAAVMEDLNAVNVDLLDKPVIAVTGIGASYAAAVVVAGELQERGRRAFAVRSCDMQAGRDLADAVIGLSHRGRSVETVDALANLPSATRLAITTDPESPLAQAADLHLGLQNEGDATPSSTGYTATLLAAGILSERLPGGGSTDWTTLAATAEGVLTQASSKMARLRELFADRRAVDCVGAGSSLGTADGTALLRREAVRLPAAAYDTRHYLHGPMESMDQTTGVVMFGAGREVELARRLDSIGCPTLLITTAEGIQDGDRLTVIRVPRLQNRIAQGIIDILSAQLFSAELSDAAGLTDVKFRYRMSDTKVPHAA